MKLLAEAQDKTLGQLSPALTQDSLFKGMGPGAARGQVHREALKEGPLLRGSLTFKNICHHRYAVT